MEPENSCIFCKMIRQENFAKRVIHEDTDYVAMLDSFPMVSSHTLIIPKKHYDYVWDVPDFTGYFAFAKLVADNMKISLGVEKVDIIVSGGSVPHAHIHLLPYTGGKWDEIKNYMRTVRKTIPEETDFPQIETLRF